jgi:hypothetical protein
MVIDNHVQLQPVAVSTNMVYKGGPEAFDVRAGNTGSWL